MFERKAQGACISFETPALLFRVLSGKRWELLATMTGGGPMTIREAARRAGRDVKAVPGDVRALLHAGILRKTETGKGGDRVGCDEERTASLAEMALAVSHGVGTSSIALCAP